MKRANSLAHVLLACLVVFPGFGAMGYETVNAWFVQKISGSVETFSTTDETTISPKSFALSAGKTKEFTVNRPDGYNVENWLWCWYTMRPTKASQMSDLSPGQYVSISADKLTCTVSYEKDGNVALGVKLKDIAFALSFAPNGGSGSMSSVDGLNIDSKRTLPSCDFARTGYRFSGWTNAVGWSFADKASVTGSSFWNKDTWSFDAKLFAKWEANAYQVVFDGNGATSGSMSQMQCQYDRQYTLSANAFAKSGFSFGGWSRTKDGPKAFDNQATVGNLTETHNGTVTLYAIWQQSDFTVTYQANGGVFSDGSTSKTKTVTLNQPYGAAPGTPTRGGYTFNGWWTKADGGSRVEATTVFSATSSQTLFAHWQSVGLQTVNVSWQAVDADKKAKGSVTGGGSYTWGSNVTLQATPSTGSKFIGWTDGVADNPRTVHVTESGKTYTAKFDLEVYKVTFNYRDSSGNAVSETQNVKYGYSATEPAAAKAGYPDYAFTSWSNDRWKSVDGTLEVNANYASTVLNVTFDANGGSVSPLSMKFNKGGKYANLPTPSRAGYSGTSWWTSSYGGSQIKNGDSVTLTGEQTLYVHWTANKYTVTYNANGGSVAKTSDEVTFDGYYNTLPTPAWRGHSFVGWFTTEAGGEQVTTSTKVKTAGDHTLWAHWTVKTYELTLDRQGGEGGSVKATAKIGEDLPSITPPTRTGYTFGGYYYATDGGGKQYYKADGTGVEAWDEEQGRTVYAKWTKKTYTVTLDLQGGTGGQTFVTATYGEKLPTVAVPTRTGYTFQGFYESAGGSGSRYCQADGSGYQTWQRDEDGVTIYASWTAKSPTVTFKPNGGSVSPTSKAVTFDGAYGPLPTPTWTGHAFQGWFTAQAGGTEVTEETTVKTAGNHDLWAHWTTNTYTVTLNPQGGTGGQASVTATYGEKLPKVAVPTRTGYAFQGYFESAGGSGRRYVQANGDGDELWQKDENNQTIHAFWTANKYTVTYNANGGTVTSTSKEVTYDSTYGSLPTPTWTGRTFQGWFTAQEGGTKVTSETKVSRAEHHTLWAQWKTKTYTVTLNPQEGQGGTASVTATYGEDLPPVTPPTRTGYTFGGYYEAVNGNGRQYYKADGTGVKAWDEDQGRTVYAKWTKKTYTVTLDPQGGTGGQTSVTATYGESLPSVTVPAREGYAFDGYFEMAGGGGNQYYSKAGAGQRTWQKDENATLYAKWTLDSYTVAFDSNGATNWVKTQTMKVGDQTNALASNEYAKVGYTFKGWADSQTNALALIVAYADKAVLKKDLANRGETNTLWAVWNTNTYWFAFDANGGTTGKDGPVPTTEFKYDVPKELPPNTYEAPEHHEFSGWSADKTASEPTFTNEETVVNLCAEDGKTNTLYAVWKYVPSDLSLALDCTNLYFVSSNKSWAIDKVTPPHKGESCLIATNDLVTGTKTVAETKGVGGTLTFWWKGTFFKGDPWSGEEDAPSLLNVEYLTKAGVQTNCIFKSVENMDWTEVTIQLPEWRNQYIAFGHKDAMTCWLDHVTWTPDEPAHPEPTDADKATITAAGVKDGKFMLSFTSDERFDYSLLTNANLLINSWGEMEKKAGTGKTVIFEPEIVDGLPQLFYKVETLQKKD